MKRFVSSIKYHKRLVLNFILIVVFLWSLTSVNWGSDLFHPGGKAAMTQIIKGLFKPDLSPRILSLAMISTFRTIAYAVTGMTIAIIIAFVFGILASGVLSKSQHGRTISKGFFRGLLGFMRAMHELIWAWLFVASIGLSPYAAIFALGIPYGGTLGRIFADMLNDVPKEPINALKASGASKLQILFYGYLPIAKIDMLSYTMYRFECAIRSSTIMSFIGLGGLGYQIQMALNDLNYNQVWTYLFFLIGLIVLIDIWSNLLRKRLLV